jgi:hypothetical protein
MEQDDFSPGVLALVLHCQQGRPDTAFIKSSAHVVAVTSTAPPSWDSAETGLSTQPVSQLQGGQNGRVKRFRSQ